MFRREPIEPSIICSEETTKMLEEQSKIRQALRDERYRNLVSFILNNSRLNHDKTKLIIDYGEIILEYIRAIEPEGYKKKYIELKQNSKED